TPHFAEELWELTGHKESVFLESYPTVNEAALVKAETEYAVQINSKIKAKIMVPKGLSNDEIQALVCAAAEIAPSLEGKSVKKCIVVPNRLVNLIIG
ncbi:MAG: class I tRNA ligase family protein, partial [Clostridia bacterium]|nr:class I tRNA ligase family protein [Clostridia bacterium]